MIVSLPVMPVKVVSAVSVTAAIRFAVFSRVTSLSQVIVSPLTPLLLMTVPLQVMLSLIFSVLVAGS